LVSSSGLWIGHWHVHADRPQLPEGSPGWARVTLKCLLNSAATRRASLTSNPDHGRPPRTHLTPPRCPTQSPERWVLVTSASHIPRAVRCFRVAGFQADPSVEFTKAGSRI
jgi:hypothetical protein